jgi:glycosyltransferase EpsF
MKVIQIVEYLDKGAVENWLVQVFLESQKQNRNIEWTFYCILGKPGRLDEAVKAAGGNIIYAPVTISSKWHFLKHLRQTLRRGKFDIIHSHHDYLSGFYLLATIEIKFEKRILHIHNTDKALPVKSVFIRKLLLPAFKKLSIRLSDIILGISKHTLETYVGKQMPLNNKFTVLYYGINLQHFEGGISRDQLRTGLDLPLGSKILLFVGRMNEQKNPVFVIDVLHEILKERDDVYALFVGEGDLLQNVINKAEIMGIRKNVRILGWQNNIAFIMKSADAFVFPRVEDPKEGLGLVIVEAQAAGLPMVISQAIVDDAIIIEELAHIVKLDNNPAEWAKCVVDILDDPHPLDRNLALDKMKDSKFEIKKATNALLELYE